MGTPAKRMSKAVNQVNKSQPVNIETNDYVEHYKRVNELAKVKNWKQDKINKMLSDRN